MAFQDFKDEVVTVVAENGAELKCQRSILCDFSPVLTTMFGTDCLESRTNRIEMRDLPEEGVKALLEFACCMDTTDALNDFAVALQLLYAAEKYDSQRLKDNMKQILLSNDDKLIPDLALNLYLFSIALGEFGHEMKQTSFLILKRFVKHSPLSRLDSFEKLNEGNPAALRKLQMELRKQIYTDMMLNAITKLKSWIPNICFLLLMLPIFKALYYMIILSIYE